MTASEIDLVYALHDLGVKRVGVFTAREILYGIGRLMVTRDRTTIRR